jgi:hypothetical protein
MEKQGAVSPFVVFQQQKLFIIIEMVCRVCQDVSVNDETAGVKDFTHLL